MSEIKSSIPTHFLVSIKPRFVQMIREGVKLYELRKSWPVTIPCPEQTVHIYESAPTSKVVGEFEVGKVIRGTPREVWNAVQMQAGVDPKEFFSYFGNRQRAVAVEILNPKWYEHPLGCWMYGFRKAPQSYALIKVPSI